MRTKDLEVMRLILTLADKPVTRETLVNGLREHGITFTATKEGRKRNG